MKIEDARKLKKGEKVCWSIGNGWYQQGIFQGLMKVTRFRTLTYDDLMTGRFDFRNGKEETVASVKYRDDNGKERVVSISIRKLQMAEGVIWINGKAR